MYHIKDHVYEYVTRNNSENVYKNNVYIVKICEFTITQKISRHNNYMTIQTFIHFFILLKAFINFRIAVINCILKHNRNFKIRHEEHTFVN